MQIVTRTTDWLEKCKAKIEFTAKNRDKKRIL